MKLRTLTAVLGLMLLGSGCGYSEEEWQMQLNKYQQLETTSQAAQRKLQAELEAERAKVNDLTQQLQNAGIDITKLKTNLEGQLSEMTLTLEQQKKALAEYQAKAKQLEAIKARFETLKKKLDALTKLGLAVTIRKNRMVISLPGDVLFDSGKETLRKGGQEILTKVATVVKADPSLLARQYQVAGHTDDKPYGGQFRDNWGLSLMRAREVLQFLIKDASTGMPSAKWSAAGFAETDPVADNASEDGRQKNRRCEVIVVPSVEEMIDLRTIAQ